MVEVKCRICGKVFQARQRNHTICSEKCREQNYNRHVEQHKLFSKTPEGKAIRKRRYKYKPSGICNICGNVVFNKNLGTCRSRKRYREECVLSKAIEAILKYGEHNTSKQEDIARAWNTYGFSMPEIKDIMVERGLIDGGEQEL